MSNNGFTVEEWVSIKESDAIKGLLTLLIIFGHCHYICPQRSLTFNYLYKFHVACFFILPFFYNKKSILNKYKIINSFIRFYWPYLLFFIFWSALNVFVLNNRFNAVQSVYAFLNGGQALLKEACGVRYLWFLPTFFAFSMIQNTFWGAIQRQYRWSKSLLFVILLFSFMIILGRGVKSFWEGIIPFATIPALFYLGIGLITFYIARIKYVKLFGSVTFCVLSIIFFYTNGDLDMNAAVFPVSAFLFLLTIRKIVVKTPFLGYLGKISFTVYMIHVFIYNTLERFIKYSPLNAVLTFLCTIMLSVACAWLINRNSSIKKFIFPNGYEELKSVFIDLRKF